MTSWRAGLGSRTAWRECCRRLWRAPCSGRLGRKAGVWSGDIFFELLAFLLLARGIFPGLGDIEDEIELDGGANHVGLGSSLGFELEGDAGDLLDGFGVSLCDGERSGAAD